MGIPDILDDLSNAPDFVNDICTEFVYKELSSLHINKSSGLKGIHSVGANSCKCSCLSVDLRLQPFVAVLCNPKFFAMCYSDTFT